MQHSWMSNTSRRSSEQNVAYRGGCLRYNHFQFHQDPHVVSSSACFTELQNPICNHWSSYIWDFLTTVLWRRHSTRRRTRENNGLATGAQEANGTYQIFLPGKLLVIFSAEIDLFHAMWATDAKDSEKTVKCGLSKTKLTRKPVVSEKQVTHVGEVAAKAAFAFKQKFPLDAHNRYREQPVLHPPTVFRRRELQTRAYCNKFDTQ
jgi:hypothetical protein